MTLRVRWEKAGVPGENQRWHGENMQAVPPTRESKPGLPDVINNKTYNCRKVSITATKIQIRLMEISIVQMHGSINIIIGVTCTRIKTWCGPACCTKTICCSSKSTLRLSSDPNSHLVWAKENPHLLTKATKCLLLDIVSACMLIECVSLQAEMVR